MAAVTLPKGADENDLVSLIPEVIREIPRTVQLLPGHIYSPDEVSNALLDITGRMDRGVEYLNAIEVLVSSAEKVHERACSRALAGIESAAEEKGGRVPAQDIRQARVFLATEDTREQLRMLKLLQAHAKRQLHNMSRQIDVVRTIGTNIRAVYENAGAASEAAMRR
jgi:hypothetical protein